MVAGLRRLWRVVRGFVSRYWDAICLFVFFLLLFGVFMQWVGVQENTRLDMTRAFVGGETSIDAFHNNTGDKIVYDGRFYGDRAPLASMIGIPAYLAGVAWGGEGEVEGRVPVSRDFLGEDVLFAAGKPGWLVLSEVLFTLLVGVVPGALLVVAVYWFLRRRFERGVALAVAFVMGVGTQVFIYSTVAQAATLGALFAFLCFSLLFRDVPWWFGAGVCGSLAVASVYYAVPVVAVLAAAAVYRGEMDDVGWFAAGLFVGAVPLLGYGIAAAGGGFVQFLVKTVVKQSVVDAGVVSVPGPSNAVFNLSGSFLHSLPLMLVVLLKLLVYPSGGLLFYAPVLLLSFVGLWWFWDRDASFWIVLMCLALLSGVLSLVGWYAGASWGSRYLVLLVPFLMLPLAWVVATSGRWAWWLAGGLGGMGLVQNLSGTFGTVPYTIQDSFLNEAWVGEYQRSMGFVWDVVETALTSSNLGLYVERLGELVVHGPRPRVFLQLVNGLLVDLWSPSAVGSYELVAGSIGDVFVTVDAGWLVVVLFAVFGLLLWRSDAVSFFDGGGLRLVVVAVAAMVLVVLMVGVSPVVVDGVLNERNSEEGVVWMGERLSVDVMADEPAGVVFDVRDTFDVMAGAGSQRFDLSLNNEEVGTVVDGASGGAVVMVDGRRDGLYRFGLDAFPGCGVLLEWFSCRTGRLSEGLLREPAGGMVDLTRLRGSFYEGEGLRLMRYQPLSIVVDAVGNRTVVVEGEATAFRNETGVLLVGEERVRVPVDSYGGFSVDVDVGDGVERFELRPERCLRPSDVADGSDDGRCLSIGFREFSVRFADGVSG